LVQQRTLPGHISQQGACLQQQQQHETNHTLVSCSSVTCPICAGR
jgi:hypothetical protein